MRPPSPSGQGTSLVHLCNRGGGEGTRETGSIVHSANSLHGSLAPGQGPGLLVSGCQCHWQRKRKYPKASPGKDLILEWAGIAIRKHIGRPPFPACSPRPLLMACAPRSQPINTPGLETTHPCPEGLTFPIASSFPPAVIQQMPAAH